MYLMYYVLRLDHIMSFACLYLAALYIITDYSLFSFIMSNVLNISLSFLVFFRPHPRFDADRIQAASSLPCFGHMYSPISVATSEPDFNKAIASVIWSRHHDQATCSIFNCGVVNCPLCPPTASRTPRPIDVEEVQIRDSPKTNTRRSTVVNWLVPSTPTKRAAVITNDKPLAKRHKMCDSESPYSSNSTLISPFACHFCPKSFSKTSTCLAHIRTHTGGRPFKCPSCPKSFTQRSSLRTHLRTHTGDRPYVCVECNGRFGDLSTLTKHRRTHTGEKPYRCHHSGCGKAFAQSGNLKRHFKTHDVEMKLKNFGMIFQ